MMKRWQKVLAGIGVFVLFLLLCVGFAAVNDQLNIFGYLDVEGQNKAVLAQGQIVNGALDDCEGVQTVIFDTYDNQSTAFQAAGFADWESGVPVDEGQRGSIRLFYHEATRTAYILAKENIDITANPDSSGMFADITTLETIWFNRFTTAATQKFDNMFSGCSQLQTIYAAADFQVGALESAENMFLDCTSLSGGKGTRVYPVGAQETTQPLDATYAKIDAVGIPGYFTNTTQVRLVYFRSNLLKAEDVQYPVKGSSVEITLSNALDSATYSEESISYQLAYYIPDGDGWSLHSSSYGTLSGGSYHTTAVPLSMQTFNGQTKVKVVANCLSGQMESLSAVFTFEPISYSPSWRVADGVIYVQLTTGADGGQYTFTWGEGITADKSDPNQLFTTAALGATSHTVQLKSWSNYEFCFFATDASVLSTLTEDPSQASQLVKITRP